VRGPEAAAELDGFCSSCDHVPSDLRGLGEVSKPTAAEGAMPTYMDVHDLPGVKAADVAGAHAAR
jgi:hypothetical protein